VTDRNPHNLAARERHTRLLQQELAPFEIGVAESPPAPSAAVDPNSLDLPPGAILAHLKSVQRFSADNPDLPAFHWKEAWITPAGESEEKVDGNGSKVIPNCESRAVHTEDGTYATLADPVAGENLSNASIDASSGQSLLSFLIRGNEDTTHTVTKYQIQVGTGTVPAARGTYGDSGDLPAGQAPTLQVAGVPLESDVYIRITTSTSDAGTLANIYIVQLALNGEPKAQVVVTDEDINDPSGAVLSSPVTGDYAGIIDEETSQTDLYLAWLPVAGADKFDVYVGSGNPASPDDPTGYDLHWAGGELTDTTYTVPNLPADGTPFWVTVWWRIGAVWHWNRWKISVTPAPDRRAISEDDLNRVLTETQAGLPGLTEIADGNEDAETELDIPVLVSIRETIDTAGNKRFVFQRVEQELHGVIVAESAPGADDDFDRSPLLGAAVAGEQRRRGRPAGHAGGCDPSGRPRRSGDQLRGGGGRHPRPAGGYAGDGADGARRDQAVDHPLRDERGRHRRGELLLAGENPIRRSQRRGRLR
jgi:hypothetical protein